MLAPFWEVGPGTPIDVRDPGAARALSLRLLSSPDRATVRALLARVEPFASVPREDPELARVLAARLVDGRLRVSLLHHAGLWAEDGEREEMLDALVREAEGVAEEHEEECIPCRDKNAQHQAEVLIEASMGGEPLCGMG